MTRQMGYDFSGYIGPVKVLKPQPAKFCGLVEDAAPTPLMKPKQFTKFTPFTQPTKPKDPIMNRDAENPAADDLKKKLLFYFEQQDATEAEKEDFIRLWDRIHKPNQAMDRLRRAFDASTTASLSRMFPDYGRLSR